MASPYPRKCSSCGQRISQKRGAFFSAKVEKGKVVKTESICDVCLALRQKLRLKCVYCGHETRRQVAICVHCADLPSLEPLTGLP